MPENAQKSLDYLANHTREPIDKTVRARYNIVKSSGRLVLEADPFYSMMIRSTIPQKDQMILSGMAKCKARNNLGEEMEKRL